MMLLRLALSLTIGLTLLAAVAARNPLLVEALDAPHQLQLLIEHAR